MHNTKAFGWILLGVAAVLAVGVYRLRSEGSSPRWALNVAGGLVVGIVALVIATWSTS